VRASDDVADSEGGVPTLNLKPVSQSPVRNRTDWPLAVDTALALGRVLSQGSVRYTARRRVQTSVVVDQKRVVGNVSSVVLTSSSHRTC